MTAEMFIEILTRADRGITGGPTAGKIYELRDEIAKNAWTRCGVIRITSIPEMRPHDSCSQDGIGT